MVDGTFNSKAGAEAGQPLNVGWAKPTNFTVPIPRNEKQRLAALRGYKILDTPPDADLDALTQLAARVCKVPMAVISLVDADRQWFKSRVGVSLTETSRATAFCAHAIMQRDLFVVPDACADVRFAGNPLVVGGPRIRFYAGAPLVTRNGCALGTLCVFDRVPRHLTPEERHTLQALARQVMTQLELRKRLNDARRQLMERRLETKGLEKQFERMAGAQQSDQALFRQLARRLRATALQLTEIAAPAPEAGKPSGQRRLPGAQGKRLVRIARVIQELVHQMEARAG